MSDTVLEARGITKTYTSEAGTLEVLRGIDLEIHRGEILAIMGQSGVGKSTLLNVIGLLDHPTEGTLRVHIDDGMVEVGELHRVERARLRNRHIGFVFQFYHLLPDLNVLENVLLPSMLRYTRREYASRERALVQRARDLLARVQVDREKHMANMLSGGERQRVAIARALMNEPTLLLCDEPTGNLDTTTGRKIHDLFVEMNRDLKTTILLVTHDYSLAARAHRRLRMVDGKFVPFQEEGTPSVATGLVPAAPLR